MKCVGQRRYFQFNIISIISYGCNKFNINFICLLQDRDEQTQLEMKHRIEEDDLYRRFARHREEEDRRIRDEFRVRTL